MDVKLLAQHMYNSIQGQLDEINSDEIKRKCGWRPQLYFFALEEFRTIEGVKGINLSSSYVHLQLNSEAVRDTLLSAIREASQKIGVIVNANGFDYPEYGTYSIAFNNHPEYVR